MNYSFLIGIISEIKTVFTEAEKECIYIALDKTPIQVVNKLYHEGWKIVACNTGDVYDGFTFTANVVGRTDEKRRCVFIKVGRPAPSMETTIIHEFGHVLDMTIDGYSCSFKSESNTNLSYIESLIAEEGTDFPNHALSDVKEFYAECFAYYVLKYPILDTKPKSTAFIADQIKINNVSIETRLKALEDSAITHIEYDTNTNKISYRKLKKRNNAFVLKDWTSSGGSSGPSTVVMDNTKTFDTYAADFAPNTITISYISSRETINGTARHGVWLVKTYRANTLINNVAAYQERIFISGEPDIAPAFKQCRYCEVNVSRSWSAWY